MSVIPIIVVTENASVRERILSLNSGADDHLVKPCDAGELLARVGAVIRRSGAAKTPRARMEQVRIGDVELDMISETVTVAGTSVRLSTIEYKVLASVVAAAGATCARQRIIAEVWGRAWKGADRTLNVHIATLRAKLARPQVIETVRGVGYRLDLSEEPADLYRRSRSACGRPPSRAQAAAR